MQLIANLIYIEFAEMVACGISAETISKAKLRGTDGWEFKDDPTDARKVLIAYEPLREKYKTLLTAHFGNVYQYISLHKINAMLAVDANEAIQLSRYTLPNGKHIDPKTVIKYLNASKYLRLLHTTTLTDCRKYGFDTRSTFVATVIAHIASNKIHLPTNYSNLMEKVRGYKQHGIISLIHKHYNNANASKFTDATADALLKELICHPLMYEDTYIADAYNEWAISNGHKTITSATVGNYRHRNAMALTAFRNGVSVYHNTFNPSTHQLRPSKPLLLINSDDNDLDLYFVRITADKKSPYYRFVLMMVVDSYNDYPLGYAIGEAQTKELVAQAYRDALYHIHDLTGEWAMWHQIKTDHWGLKGDLKEFYDRQALFTPATAGNARAKSIEQSFGKTWHSTLKGMFPINYAGNNITAKTKMNTDALQRRQRNFPMASEAPEYIAKFINAMRHTLNKKTKNSRQQDWLQGYQELAPTQKRIITDRERLLWFGIPTKRPITITNKGLVMQLEHKKYIYELQQADYMKHIGSTLNVYYDPLDMSKVLATNEAQTVQIQCTTAERIPMAIMDMQPGDRARLHMKLLEKKEMFAMFTTEKKDRQAILQREGIDAQSVLQSGNLTKELNKAAQYAINPAPLALAQGKTKGKNTKHIAYEEDEGPGIGLLD